MLQTWGQALSPGKVTFLAFAIGSGLVTWKCTFLAFGSYDIHLDKA
jgi:hypothetical protein